ncbi:hypothetical protein E4T42_01418 [Aureobasidium subglaciale]|nr:hypothetical protein E4T42_01418 [Aureobasidium subglaciale]
MSTSTKNDIPGGVDATHNDLTSDMRKAFQIAWDKFVVECGKSPGCALSKEECARFAKSKPWFKDESSEHDQGVTSSSGSDNRMSDRLTDTAHSDGSQDRCPDMHDRLTTLDTGYHDALETRLGSNSSLAISSMSVTDNKIDVSKHIPELKVSGVTHGSIFNKPSHFVDDANHVEPAKISAHKTTEQKHVMARQPTSQENSTSRDELEELRLAAQNKAVAFMSDRVQYWKAKLAEQKDISSTDEPGEELLAEVIDFNSSMLSREDYDQMIADRAADKNIVLSKHENEEVSESEKKAAITALIYGINVLKAASSSQRHQTVSEVLHPRVRQLQPSLAFEMTALLLNIDTKRLLEVTVDGDALYNRTKAVAKTWGVDITAWDVAPSGIPW